MYAKCVSNAYNGNTFNLQKMHMFRKARKKRAKSTKNGVKMNELGNKAWAFFYCL